jgi:hypothetical protein
MPNVSPRSLAGVLGVMTSASLAVSIIGQALAQARGKAAKHAVKQIDRLLSNQGIDVWTMFPHWIKELVVERPKLEIAMDWTDFDADDQTTLVFSLISSYGRATPLLWFYVFKAELEGKRNDIEDMCLEFRAHRRSPPPRPDAAAQRRRHRAAYTAWRGWRSAWHGPPSQKQHGQAPRPLVNRQGCLYYDTIPNMPELTLRSLVERFRNLIAENKVTDAIFRAVQKFEGILEPRSRNRPMKDLP